VHVAFVNENTLGHSSYLRPFVHEFERRLELGVQPHWLDATPLPASSARWANVSVRGLRKFGLDFQIARWRLLVSAHVRRQLLSLRGRQHLDAVVVNTQSVGLALASLAPELPVFVCLDATFHQLARSRWFAPNRASKWLHPLTLYPLRGRERRLFNAASGLLPWSAVAAASLREHYGIGSNRIVQIPPSIDLPPQRVFPERPNIRPQILFVGGDLVRKGGPLLLECFRRWFSSSCELHLVTESAVPSTPGVVVHRGLKPHSAGWLARWTEADLFVFPSTLETFGIVLVEALAFEVPVVSADVGAAREILANGQAGLVLGEVTLETLRTAIENLLGDRVAARQLAERGRLQVQQRFNLPANSELLAQTLRSASNPESGSDLLPVR